MSLQTWVARFVVDHGRVTEEGSRLRSFERRRLDEPDADLYVLAEPRGEKSEELAGQALDAIGRAFLADRLSLTGGLLRALRSTHQTLLEWNRRSVPRDQVAMGVSAAIVCGPIVYLAQCGPGTAFLRHNGRLQRLAPLDSALAPLGEGDLNPSLRRIEMQAGDIILVASQEIEAIISDDRLDDLLARGSEEALPELYLLTRDLSAFALFAVSCLEPRDDGSDAAAESAFSSQSQESAQAQTGGRDLFAASDLEARARETRLLIAYDRPDEPSAKQPRDGADPDPLALAPAPVDISRPIVRLRPGLAPSRSDYPRTTGPARAARFDLVQPRLLALLAGVVFVMLVGAFAVPDLIRENRTEKLTALVNGASLQLTAAATEPDPARKRVHLEEAYRLATEARRIQSDYPDALRLQQEASDALRVMNAVFDLGPMTTVATLSRQLTGDFSIAAMTVAGSTAYLLDTRGNRVIAVPLDGSSSPRVIYEAGATYGGSSAKKPQFIAWQGDERSGRLLILDQERKLFEVPAGSTPGPLSLRRTNTWASVAGIAAYDGNLYVLDPRGHQVHRYLPAAQGFDSEPTALLSGNRNLEGASGLAVGGDVYIYFENGSVRRFSGGVDAGFSLAGIDRPLKAPTDIALMGGADEVYIADSGNKRIVVTDSKGTFRRQLVSTAMTDIRCLALNSSGSQLYIVVGDSLLSAPVVR